MSKKIITLILSILMIVCCFTACKSNKLTLGDYSPIDTESLSAAMGDVQVTEDDFNFKFQENGKFSAYLSFGNSIGGDYIVKGGRVICNIIWAEGESAIQQSTVGEITFKITNDNKLVIEEIPESYNVLITELVGGEWSTSNEPKQMPFSPLEKGVELSIKK